MITLAIVYGVTLAYAAVVALVAGGAVVAGLRAFAARRRGERRTLGPYTAAVFVAVAQAAVVYALYYPYADDAARALGADEHTARLVAFVPTVASFAIALLAPTVIPIVRAYAMRDYSWRAYAASVLSILALPFALSLFVVIAAYTHAVLAQVPVDYLAMLQPKQDFPACARAMMGGLGLDTPEPGQQPASEMLVLLWFWIEMSLKAILLDAMEIYGCGVSALEHDADSFAASSLVFVYRAFASAMFVTVILLPLRAALDRRRQAQA